MAKAVYAGTFDPVTNGHLTIIERASRSFDELVIVVADNPKKSPLLTSEQRRSLIRSCVSHMPNVRVTSWNGLVVEFCKAEGATVMVRGLRAVTDFEYELGLANINHDLDPAIDTVFFPTHPESSFISSSMVKELAHFGRDITKYVPGIVAEAVRKAKA